MDNNNNMVAAAPVVEKNGAKKGNGLMIATVLFGISTIALGTTLAVKMMNDESGNGGIEDKTGNKCIITQGDIEDLDEGKVSEIIADYNNEKEVRDLVDRAVQYLGNGNEARNTVSPMPQSLTYDSANIPVKLESGAYTLVNKSFGFLMNPTDLNYANNYTNALKDFLTSEGFALNSEFGNDYVSYYNKDTIRCGITENVLPFSFNCSDENWLKEDTVELVNSLHDALVAAGEQADNVMYIANPEKIETSNNGKYERIVGTLAPSNLGAGSGYALFYREVGATDWTFLLFGNGIPSCDKFEGAAGEAFAGSDLGCSEGSEIKNVGE